MTHLFTTVPSIYSVHLLHLHNIPAHHTFTPHLQLIYTHLQAPCRLHSLAWRHVLKPSAAVDVPPVHVTAPHLHFTSPHFHATLISRHLTSPLIRITSRQLIYTSPHSTLLLRHLYSFSRHLFLTSPHLTSTLTSLSFHFTSLHFYHFIFTSLRLNSLSHHLTFTTYQPTFLPISPSPCLTLHPPTVTSSRIPAVAAL